jgi:Spy/CpxP family protein refolding chaperone
MILSALVLFFTIANPVFATQDAAPQDPASDPIERLRLSPEQRQRIRIILEDNKPERQRTNRRLREANVALDQALDAQPIDENVVEQRITELAAAQAAQLRMRIQTEIKIRRELRPEQLAILQQLHLQIRDVVGDQRPANSFTPPRRRDAFRPNRKP